MVICGILNNNTTVHVLNPCQLFVSQIKLDNLILENGKSQVSSAIFSGWLYMA